MSKHTYVVNYTIKTQRELTDNEMLEIADAIVKVSEESQGYASGSVMKKD